MSKEKVAAVLFVCTRYPEVNLVMKSTSTQVVGGRTVPDLGRSITFRKMPFRGQVRGEHLTQDPVEIEFLRGHEWNGVNIFEEAIPSQADRKPPEDRVSQGVASSGAREAEPEVEAKPPADVPKGPPKAKIAKGLKKAGRKPKLVPEEAAA